MTDFSERRRALVDSVFATFGEAATWHDETGAAIPLRVRFGKGDEDDRFGSISIVRSATIIRVPGWRVSPSPGDLVHVTTGENAGTYIIGAKPMRDRKGVWDCPAEITP